MPHDVGEDEGAVLEFSLEVKSLAPDSSLTASSPARCRLLTVAPSRSNCPTVVERWLLRLARPGKPF